MESAGILSRETQRSGVSWGAILAGAAVATAVGLALTAISAALGLSFVSPFSSGNPGRALGRVAIMWLVVSQFVSLALGGYIAGRLRARWIAVHTDEVFFRDTAHGFVVWAVCMVATAGLLASAAGNIVNNTTHTGVGAAVAAGSGKFTGSDAHTDSDWYGIDSLFRSNKPTAAGSNNQQAEGEAARILLVDLRQDAMPQADKDYLSKLIAAHSDITPEVAAQRVEQLDSAMRQGIADAKAKAEIARKAAMHASLWVFLALLVGAFSASCAAAIGGELRDKAHIHTI